MRKPTALAAVAVFAAGGLLGWVVTSGRLATELHGQDKAPEKAEVKTTETRVGKLQFESGYPTRETVSKLYDEMDFQRACQAYLWGLPIVGLAEWKHANDHVFKVRNGQPSRRKRL